mmetsp:Transcript_5315/g.10046  ORF Transcript_5315/g.10046 Transcript_5315/m.10046 type:complete len:235 (-) Transcript_5315:1487-2191(-)
MFPLTSSPENTSQINHSHVVLFVLEPQKYAKYALPKHVSNKMSMREKSYTRDLLLAPIACCFGCSRSSGISSCFFCKVAPIALFFFSRVERSRFDQIARLRLEPIFFVFVSSALACNCCVSALHPGIVHGGPVKTRTNSCRFIVLISFFTWGVPSIIALCSIRETSLISISTCSSPLICSSLEASMATSTRQLTSLELSRPAKILVTVSKSSSESIWPLSSVSSILKTNAEVNA